MFEIKVKNVNDPPEITSTPVTSATEDKDYDYQVTAEDIDGDNLSYSLNKQPEGMSIVKETGKIEWIPSQEDVGSHDIEVLVQDGKGGSDSQTYTLEVENVNSKPEIVDKSVSSEEGTTEDEFKFMLTYRDEDNEAPSNVYVVINGEKKEMTKTSGEDFSDGVVYTTTEKLDAGTNQYYFSVEDSEGRTDSTSAQTVDVEQSETPWMAYLGTILLIALILMIILIVYFREYREVPEESEISETEEEKEEGEIEDEELFPGFGEEESEEPGVEEEPESEEEFDFGEEKESDEESGETEDEEELPGFEDEEL